MLEEVQPSLSKLVFSSSVQFPVSALIESSIVNLEIRFLVFQTRSGSVVVQNEAVTVLRLCSRKGGLQRI
jgi:hypothetical protein